jgi:hypothetical protein
MTNDTPTKICHVCGTPTPGIGLNPICWPCFEKTKDDLWYLTHKRPTTSPSMEAS